MCASMMEKCCNPKAMEGHEAKINFKTCEQMMKNFFADKNVKAEMEACCSKIQKYWQEKKESTDTVNK